MWPACSRVKQGCPTPGPGSWTLSLCGACLPEAADFNTEQLISRDGHGLLCYSFSEWTQIKTLMETGLPHCTSIPCRWYQECFLISTGDGMALLWTLTLLAEQWACDGLCLVSGLCGALVSNPWTRTLWISGWRYSRRYKVSIGGTYTLNSSSTWSLDFYVLRV